MPQRVRMYNVRYGGEYAGLKQNGPVNVTSYNGQHYCLDETHIGPPYRSGGPLLVKKKKVFIHRTERIFSSVLPSGYYDGFMWVPPYIPAIEPTPLGLSGWGAKGYARTQPLHPIYNLGVSIGELKDFPRMVVQTVRGFQALSTFFRRFPAHGMSIGSLLSDPRGAAKKLGDAYLYGAFGLWPMIQDLLFLLQMREKLDQKLRWLRNHNGKSVRRKVTLDAGGFSENIARSATRANSMNPFLSSFNYPAGQSTVQDFSARKTYNRKIWFAAKYRYYIPELAKPFGGRPKMLSADLLGLSADPAIIFRLVPWTWLLSWFVSADAVISNIYARAVYHVVAEYAYVMCSEHFTYEAPGQVTVHTGNFGNPVWTKPDRTLGGVSRTEYEFRQRQVANPYGFGITFASLSAYQWSILVALGLSRGGKHSAPRT